MTQDRLDRAGRTGKVIMMITTKAVFYFLVSFPLEVQQVHACERFCFWFKSYLQWHSHTDQLKWLRNEFRLQWIRSNPCLPLVGKLQFVFVHFSSFFFCFFFFRFDGGIYHNISNMLHCTNLENRGAVFPPFCWLLFYVNLRKLFPPFFALLTMACT